MAGHSTRVAVDDEGGLVAVCSCGWISPIMRGDYARAQATRAGQAHCNAAVSRESMRDRLRRRRR